MGSQPTKVPLFSLTAEVDIESTNRAYIASILVIAGIVKFGQGVIREEKQLKKQQKNSERVI